MTAGEKEFMQAVDTYVTALFDTGRITTATARGMRKALCQDVERGQMTRLPTEEG